MTRNILPDRRPSLTFPVEWQDHKFHVTVGFDPRTGEMSEVFFADGQKSGTGLQHTITDACVILSIAMQYGVSPDAFGKSLGRSPAYDSDVPASPIGAIVEGLCNAVA